VQSPQLLEQLKKRQRAWPLLVRDAVTTQPLNGLVKLVLRQARPVQVVLVNVLLIRNLCLMSLGQRFCNRLKRICFTW